MKTETIEFEPILLEKDEVRISSAINEAEGMVKKLNNVLDVALDFLGQDLNDSEIMELLKGGFDQAMVLIRKQYQFPKADDDFNLRAMGKDPAPVKLAIQGVSGCLNAYEFIAQKSKIVLIPERIEAIRESICIYTDNEFQNEAYHAAVVIAKALNDAQGKGLIDRTSCFRIETAIDLIKHGSGDRPFYPNPRHIKKIEANGRILSMA